ncbi:MAG TPA: PIN domain-containing protein [Candidatus Saccharimonadales bacterium]
MQAIETLLVIATLAILAEVTYLVVKLPRQNLSRKQSRPILVDTSVLIDGRIIAVAQSGFIGDALVIPRSVIGELQFLADNADHDKRARARYGLDVVKELQAMPHLKVEILQDGSKAEEGVDERLLTLAKKHGAAVCTIDYNLNKVAVVEGITVLNVNELAQSLRMAYLPGEKMLLELVQKGQDSHQGVGYLTDGTMVVVEHASKNIGQTIEIEFIRSLQTAAGKMMFAKPVERQQSAPAPKQKPIGKRRVQPQPVVETKTEVVVAEPVKAFHSDSKERRFTKRPNKQAVPPNATQRPSRKPRTSTQREAALIDLVDKQE